MADRAAWRDWLSRHHDSECEVFILIAKDRSGKPGLRYGEAVEEALCFGWIDGIARRHDDDFSLNRFTGRRQSSNWSDSNRERIRRLGSQGRIQPSGIAALPEDLRAEVDRPKTNAKL